MAADLPTLHARYLNDDEHMSHDEWQRGLALDEGVKLGGEQFALGPGLLSGRWLLVNSLHVSPVKDLMPPVTEDLNRQSVS